MRDPSDAADLPPPAAVDRLVIRGAREHNLKNLAVDIPHGKFVVVTGVSGSGKSTLAFDLVFAEGQRRFLDCLSAYARQFVEQMARPDVDLIAGLPPTVSIEQQTSRGGGKSTVATVTEIQHFLRLLFARLGTQHCPGCGVAVTPQTRDEVRASLAAEAARRGDLLLLAPVVKGRKGFHADVAVWAARRGYAELRADGKMHRTDRPFRLDRFKEHDIEAVIGVLEKPGRRGKKTSAEPAAKPPQQLVDEALTVGKGTLYALDNHGRLTTHSTERACPQCGRSFEPLDPKQFSYNSSKGWCPRCRGFGELFYLPEAERGAGGEAVEESWWRWAEGQRETCPECRGARLNPVARAVRLHLGTASGRSEPARRRPAPEAPTLDTLGAMSADEAWTWLDSLRLAGREAEIARDILPEIRERLRFLREVGLGYLRLARAVPTLSGGEAQRIRLAAQLGSNLSGVLYVLDEPTIGLHPRDNAHLLRALELLKARGNSLLVVEHDEDTMRRADWIIDLGPGAGVEGGRVVAAGTLAELLRHEASVTGRLLRDKPKYPTRGCRRLVGGSQGATSKRQKAAPAATKDSGPGTPDFLTLHAASLHNLKGLTVRFPLGRFTVVTGVSGSGKSTLVKECLLPAVQDALRRKGRGTPPAGAPFATGSEDLGAVHEVDQSPIGRTPRSTPATYVGFFDDIRALFAQLPEAKLRGYGAGRFSFNSPQGRCPACEGAGAVKLEMNFLPPAFVKCEACGGTRFNRETLDVEYAGKNIAQVLDLSVDEAIGFFAALPRIRRPLEALRDTGLGYLRLGQTSPTLSGGEAQRVKLVTHLLGGLKADAPRLRGPAPRPALILLEEPTIGLHLSDVRRLVEVLQRLVDHGHTVIVIEHHLDLIAEADWVIDLGPEAGDGGGQIVCEGPPEAVARHPRSHTGRHLRPVLGG